MNPISVLLVDDNPTFLQEHDDVVVASTAGGGRGPSPNTVYLAGRAPMPGGVGAASAVLSKPYWS